MLYILKYQNTSEYTTKTNFLVLFFEPAMSNALLVIVLIFYSKNRFAT